MSFRAATSNEMSLRPNELKSRLVRDRSEWGKAEPTGRRGPLLFFMATASIALFGCNALIGLELGEPEVANGSGGQDGGDGGTNPECVPSEVAMGGSGGAGMGVGNECGVFLSSVGDDAYIGEDLGTTGHPVKTFKKAIELAQAPGGKGHIYVCNESFTEVVVVPAGITIYGGLDCQNGWIHTNTPTMLMADPGQIPLTFDGTKETGAIRVEDLRVNAADAAATGDSSVAAVANGANVTLKNTTLVAGNAKEGAAGEDVPGMAMAGAIGNPGASACSADDVPGGGVVINDCGIQGDTTDDSTSGSGGDGTMTSGEAGSPGAPGETTPNAGLVLLRQFKPEAERTPRRERPCEPGAAMIGGVVAGVGTATATMASVGGDGDTLDSEAATARFVERWRCGVSRTNRGNGVQAAKMCAPV